MSRSKWSPLIASLAVVGLLLCQQHRLRRQFGLCAVTGHKREHSVFHHGCSGEGALLRRTVVQRRDVH